MKANNRAWELVESQTLSAEQAQELLAASWTAHWHWSNHLDELDAETRCTASNRLRALHLLCCAAARREVALRSGASRSGIAQRRNDARGQGLGGIGGP
ncbi:MAG: hypothetical protein O2855_06325 [Planctomycetota bacterium]|nr:hypothetical protein [Planctomycetota bacterium]